jgi:hypothetical protein
MVPKRMHGREYFDKISSYGTRLTARTGSNDVPYHRIYRLGWVRVPLVMTDIVADSISSGARGISDNEAVFYIFDGIPMLLLALSFVIVWPPSCLPEMNGIVEHRPRGYPLASR